MSNEETIRGLGQKIYKSTAEVSTKLTIEGAVESEELKRRKEQLALAAKWNAIALDGCKR